MTLAAMIKFTVTVYLERGKTRYSRFLVHFIVHLRDHEKWQGFLEADVVTTFESAVSLSPMT